MIESTNVITVAWWQDDNSETCVDVESTAGIQYPEVPQNKLYIAHCLTLK
jgi:hypothetical protein